MDIREILMQLRAGISQRQIAQVVGLNRRTVKKYNQPPGEREVLGSPPEGGTVVGKPRWG